VHYLASPRSNSRPSEGCSRIYGNRYTETDFLIRKELALFFAANAKTPIGEQYRLNLIKDSLMLEHKHLEIRELVEAQKGLLEERVKYLEQRELDLQKELRRLDDVAVKLKDLYKVSLYRIGRNNWYRTLREEGLLTKMNEPTSIAIRSGYLTKINNEVFIASAGLGFINDLLKEKEKQMIINPTVDDIRGLLQAYSEEIEFNEEQHIYAFRGNSGPSVSSYLKNYVPEFPEDFMAGKVAEKRTRETGEYVSKESILLEWKNKRDYAANRGSFIHFKLEEYLTRYTNKEVKNLTINYDILDDESKTIDNGIKMLDELVDSGYEVVDTELMMYDPVRHLFGTADLVLLKEGKVIIADFKTNDKDIEEDHYNNYLKAPYTHLKASTLNKYKVQLDLYTELFEGTYPFKVAEKLVLHIRKAGYKIYSV